VRVRCTGDLDAKRPVPFRLTPNIAEFLTQTGVTGSLTAAMVASARCFVQPHYKFASYLRAMLRDEYITWHKKVSLFQTPFFGCRSFIISRHGYIISLVRVNNGLCASQS
jgi:phosphatidylinositol kinase/protein kinase (PI-3  family)